MTGKGYNKVMTTQQVLNFEPISMHDKVLVDRAMFEEMKECYVRAHILAEAEQARADIKAGKGLTHEQVFGELQKKYGYKI